MKYLTALLALMVALVAADRSGQAPRKVKLRDLTAITLHANRKTSARRSAAIPQLECIGGDACADFQPRVVQCRNVGFDGYDVQWSCTAELPSNIEFGDIEVSCEGYDFPDDPFILVNSCGLEYSLHYKDSPKPRVSYDDQRYFPTSSPKSLLPSGFDAVVSKIFSLISLGVLLAVAWSIFQTCTGRRSRGGSGFGPGSPWPWFGGDDSYGGGPPPGKGSRGGYQPPTGISPGFWTGVGLGGLGAYMLNRPRQEQTIYRQASPLTSYAIPSTSYSRTRSSEETSSPSSSMSSASGFGGTRRR
ncbi:transmembrane protein 66-like protein [Umbelopsis sp. PMI_123]|nr:transmembrane protein 66-like protein [Umbelopsis sp. PMI_123]